MAKRTKQNSIISDEDVIEIPKDEFYEQAIKVADKPISYEIKELEEKVKQLVAENNKFIYKIESLERTNSILEEINNNSIRQDSINWTYKIGQRVYLRKYQNQPFIIKKYFGISLNNAPIYFASSMVQDLDVLETEDNIFNKSY